MSKKGKIMYRVWNIINVPNSPTFFPVNSPEEGVVLVNIMAAVQLKEPTIITNAFGLEVYEDGEWTVWYDDGGNDFDRLADSLIVVTVGGDE